MELYFNPYPGAAKSIQEGVELAVKVADTLFRLKKDLQNIPISGTVADFDVLPSAFILIREKSCEYRMNDIFHKAQKTDLEKLRFLLSLFGKGRVMNFSAMENIDNWVVSNIGVPAPVLEMAAKNGAIALTVPTEPEWRVDLIGFMQRPESLHNLWGQDDISHLKDYCIESLSNIRAKFSEKYGAIFCDGALNSSPDYRHWERFGFFNNMNKAVNRGYKVDDDLIKNVGDTKYGTLLELRCYGDGWRIFFVFREYAEHKILIGGFYHKNSGSSQNQAINDAKARIDSFTCQECETKA